MLTVEDPPSPSLVSQRSIRINKNVYCSDTLSALKTANGLTIPIEKFIKPIPVELIESQIKLNEKPKPVHMLRAKVNTDVTIASGDMVDVFVKRDGKIS